MRRFLRLLILWLLALALPLQGALAAAMPETKMQAATPQETDVASTAHAMAMAMNMRPYSHRACCPTASEDGFSATMHASLAHGGCPGGCAFCGLGAAMAQPTPTLAPVAVAAPSRIVRRRATSVTAPTFLTSGLDRPPRRFLA